LRLDEEEAGHSRLHATAVAKVWRPARARPCRRTGSRLGTHAWTLCCAPMGKVVVIAVPAGGVEAIKRLVSGLAVPCSASILIVPHIEGMPRLLPHILRQVTRLPVEVSVDGRCIAPGHIYVAPTDRQMLLEAGCLRLNRWPALRHSWSATDPLFASAAASYRERAVGIVLTGGDGYGAAGLRAIRDAGGLAIVQDPRDMVVHDRPVAPLAVAHPHPCLPLGEIAAHIGRFCAAA
jgi:two-component system, chemotaxis family, protein-glutamate methylesterase/glutaminase